ncbi:MAG: hypothetical protein GY861_24930 [bacterium]|nr:hypothetical protein [bacterium]
MKKPESMDECIYFTQRDIDGGEAMVWVFKQECPKCKKAIMGKPIGDNGKVKVRAKEYVCPECGYTVEKQEYEEGLTACAEYTCPKCKNQGELQVPFKRKNIDGVLTLRLQCEKCECNLDITKKMKEKKKKK